MKHVFLVNSHMTFLSGMKVVEFRNLSKADCVFMMARDYPLIEDGIQSIIFPFSNFPEDTFSAKQWPWRLWSKMKKADQLMTELTNNDSFHFYAPQSSTTHFYIISSHEKCEGYSFLEGGVGCYETFHQTNATQKATPLRNAFYALQYKGRVPVEKYFYNISLPKYRFSYGSNKAAFKGYPNQVVMGFAFTDRKEYKAIKEVLVFDAIIEFYKVKESTVEDLLVVLFEHLEKTDSKTLYFKLHPEHYRVEDLKQRYLKMLAPYETKFNIIELNKEVKLEDVAYSSEATFYTFISSIALYATLMDREVISFMKLLNQMENSEYKYKKIGDKAIKYF